MTLSEEEARLLAQLEQSLAAEDPEFASTLAGSKFEAQNKRLAVVSGLAFVAGVGALLGGAMAAWTWLGVVGFLVMTASAYFFVDAMRKTQVVRTGDQARGSAAPKKNSSGSFVDRMEDRWNKRRDDDFL